MGQVVSVGCGIHAYQYMSESGSSKDKTQPSLTCTCIHRDTINCYDSVDIKVRLCIFQFSVPGNDVVLRPELYITVLAYTSILSPETPQVNKIQITYAWSCYTKQLLN